MASVGYVPEDQRTTAWYLFHPRFMCSVPLIHTMSKDYIRHFGMPSCGIPEYDRGIANEWESRLLTVDDMVDYFKRGVNIRVKKPSDTKTIYEYISNHLIAWKKQLDESLNTKNAPLEDLVDLDRFASIVYPHAQKHFENDFVDSILVRRMMEASRINRDNILTKPAPSIVRIRGVDEGSGEVKKPERQSMADIFAGRNSLDNGGFKWK